MEHKRNEGYVIVSSNIPAAPAYGAYLSQLIHIPYRVVPIIFSLIKGWCKQGTYWTKGSLWWSWSHHFQRFTVATMTWLTVTEHLCHKWPRICSVCRKHNHVLFPLTTYCWVCNKSNKSTTTGVTSGAGTAHPSGAPTVFRLCCSIFIFLCSVL